MTLSLRARLLIGVIALVVLGLLISDVATYKALQGSLLNRIDTQLQTGRITAVSALGGPPGEHGGVNFPVGTVVELIDSNGTVISGQVVYLRGTTPSTARPVLPKSLPNAGQDTPSAPFTVAGTGGVEQFRVTTWPEGSFRGDFVVLAIPMSDEQSTLDQLLILEATISLGIVIATGVLAFFLVRIGLRPLERMGDVAQHIAGGDLSRRVEPATPKTEIGRLGLALNSMLNQIESAFAERTASNTRLRRFVADASHELRTPLTSIRGYSEMLRRGAAESPADAEVARRRIEEEAVRMSALVDDMLLIARLDQGRPLDVKPVDLQAIARDAADDARAVAPKRDIKLDAPSSVIVPGDDIKLRQVLGNLVRNALVHTPPQTPVEIGVSTRDGQALLSVTDHGPGLKPDEVARIFEPFYRADPSRSRDSGGAGLGLSIVNAVVLAHGGQVNVRETSGGGATFEVELPLAS
jgi:two-component system OmpR family sensor kinase